MVGAVAAVAGIAIAAAPARASHMTTVQASNPASYYRFEEAAGPTLADLGSRNLPATLNGGFTPNQAGIPGGDPTDQAVLFNGTSGFASVAGTYTGTAYPITIEAFFKTTGTGANLKIAGLTNNASGTTSENLGVYVQAGKAGLRIRSAAGGDQSFQGASPVVVNDGKFHQIVGVFDSATQRELYVDGVLVTTSTATAAFPNINTLDIGALGRANTADFFPGTIDEVAVFNVALDAQTVAAHFAASGVPEPSVVGLLALGTAGALGSRRRRDRA